jgi:hypothetical protein
LSSEALQTRDDAFDATFVATGHPADLCLRLLDEELRSRIVNLTRYEAALEIRLHEGALTICRLEVLEDGEELTRFARAAVALLEHLLDTVDSLEGITFMEEEGGKEVPPAVCKICGTAIADRPVYCRRCGTPHHRECWKYNRGCSTFACAGKRFTRRPPRS